MGFGALVAAIQGSVTAPPASLWVNGTDVLQGSGALGGRYGVPRESIEIVENGPPGVSSLKCLIRDPLKVITLTRGQPVFYQDHVNDRPLFRGFVQTWTIRPDGLGRTFALRCIGVEALLDWMVVPSITIATGTRVRDAIQAIVGVAIGPGVPLRTGAGALGSGFAGTQDLPIAAFDQALKPDMLTVTPVVITAAPLRQALAAVFSATIPTVVTDDTWRGAIDQASYQGTATIDFRFGLRCYGKIVRPGGYADLTVTDTAAGTFVADGLGHTVDVGDVPAGVFVQGGAAAGTGVLAMGDGLPGPIRIISDSSVLTDVARRAASGAYLTEHGAVSERGGFALEDAAITTEVHPGSYVLLTDAETGATGNYPISSITKTFTGLRATWKITYGGLPASLPRSMRRLTRATLS